jgi:sarcosine oxidase subunit alpha
MTGSRIDSGGLIDRSAPLSFTFYGRRYSGFAGDTLASALLANGLRVVGRSFKFHRPRGVWGGWFDDPNAIFNVRLGDNELPNCQATTTSLVNGMQARAVNAWPNAQNDLKGGLDLLHRWLGAGFYYKTFMWPNWHLFEPTIRRMAGLGHLDPQEISNYASDQIHDHCDTLIVGGGAAGLAAARVAAEAGQDVVLIDDHPQLGGGLYRRGLPVEGETPQSWVASQEAAIRKAGGRILTNTTGFGVYDHNLVGLVEDRGFGSAPRLYRMRAARVLMATGALDRPITFANNDRPGVMSVEAATEYLGRYDVLVGQRIALLSNNSFAEPAAGKLRDAGADVTVLDASLGAARALGGKTLRGVSINGKTHDCDTLLASGGLTPIVHLWRHAGGKLNWREDLSAFVPGTPPKAMAAIGGANGTFDIEQALSEARLVAQGASEVPGKGHYTISSLWPEPGAKGRQWIDFQHDVTLKDVEQAARENFVSVEHLKRYTTLGMASDQGKTSNMAGLAAMAAIQGKSIPETGTTTFRPPFVPVPIELYRGQNRSQARNPLKRLPLERAHRNAGAAMGEYGGWLRPGWYGDKPATEALRDECIMARKAAGIFDGSPLGKIEVMGPDAEAFVNFIYYNTIKTLKPGAIRYGFMLTERGVVYDDGVIMRLGQDRFVISCSSSHVDGVNGLLEAWRQDGNDPDRIFVHDTTANWPTVTVTGPKARDIVSTLDTDVEFSPDAFPHMTFRETTFQNAPARIARVSFTGDVGYEVSVPVSKVEALWDRLLEAGQKLGAGPIGLEALSVLRAEKGYLIIGKDTDGEVMPHDLGFGVPRKKKSAEFLGDRSLHTEVANDSDRRQFVGLSVPEGAAALPTGAHIVDTRDGKPVSIGIVTSSYDSAHLGHPIALALVQRGNERMGESLTAWHLGKSRPAKVVSPCFYDPNGERLNA